MGSPKNEGKQNGEAIVPEKITLPQARTITDSSGRKVAVNVIGKSGQTITFTRDSDGRRFELALDSLSDEDQIYFANVENLTAPEQKKEEASVSLNESRIRAVKEDLEKARTEMDVLQDKLSSVGEETPRGRGYARDLKRLRQREAELNAELTELR